LPRSVLRVGRGNEQQEGETCMRALVCKQHGEPEGLGFESWPASTPQAGEVRIAVHAAGLNYSDISQVAGKYQIDSAVPCVFGAEGAGEVVSCGPGVEGFLPGDRVLVLAMGCWAEEVCMPAGGLVKLSDDIDMVDAVAYCTAWHTLLQRGNLKAGEILLVHGATASSRRCLTAPFESLLAPLPSGLMNLCCVPSYQEESCTT